MHDYTIPFYGQPCLENIYSKHGFIAKKDQIIYIFNKAYVLDLLLVLLFVHCCKEEEDEEAQ